MTDTTPNTSKPRAVARWQKLVVPITWESIDKMLQEVLAHMKQQESQKGHNDTNTTTD